MAQGLQRNSHGSKLVISDDIDLVDNLLNETGCADFHYQVQV